MGTTGMTWESLKDPINGMRDVLILMSVEWAVLLILAFYLDQASMLGGGIRRKPLSCFRGLEKKLTPSLREPSIVQKDSNIILDMEKPDIAKEVGLLSYLPLLDFSILLIEIWCIVKFYTERGSGAASDRSQCTPNYHL